ncbi:hypothetical protein SprV_0401509900 [Sparganum proliferum]
MDGTAISAPPRGRLARARTAPVGVNPPPSFGVDFTRLAKPATAKNVTASSNAPPPPPTQATANSTVETVVPPATVTGSQAAFSSTESFMQRYGDSPRRPVGIQRQSAIRISPAPQQDVRVNKLGSVVIPRRTPVRDEAMGLPGGGGPFPRPEVPLDSASLATAFVSPRIGRASSSRQYNRVHFATPVGATTTPAASAVPASQSQTGLCGDNHLVFKTQSSLSPLSQQHGVPVQSSGQMTKMNGSSGQIPPSAPQFSGFATQQIPAYPASYPTASPAIPFPTPAASGQQAFLHNQMGTPSAPAFAVIAQDSSALQALLSGNVGGRAFIVQPLNISPYAAPTQLVGGAPTFVAPPSTPPAGVACSLPTYGPASNFPVSMEAQRTPMMFPQNWGLTSDPGVYSNLLSGQSQMLSSQPAVNVAQPLTPTPVGTGVSIFTQPSETIGSSTSSTHLPSSSLQNPGSFAQVQNLTVPQASASLPGSLCCSPNPDVTTVDSAGQPEPLQPLPPQIHTSNLVTPQTHRAALTPVQTSQSSASASQSQETGDSKNLQPRRTPGKIFKFRDSFTSPREDLIKTSLRKPQKLQVPPFLQSQEADPPLTLVKPLVSQPPPPLPTQVSAPALTAVVTAEPISQPQVAMASMTDEQHQQHLMEQDASAQALTPTNSPPPSRSWLRGQRRELIKKTHSLPESEHLKALARHLQDISIPSVADRARMWQCQRQTENVSESNFVDRDLVACEDLVPVEDRVRAFDSGKVAEANAAERRRLQEDYEEALSRRLQEQFGTEEASVSGPTQTTTLAKVLLNPRTQMQVRDTSARLPPGAVGANLPESGRSRGNSRLRSLGPSKNMVIPERTKQPSQLQIQCTSPRVIFNDPLARLSVREKSNIFNRRPTGGKPAKVERQRRKTQPITFDDIARANQRILDSAGGLALESPLESFIDEEFDIGSMCSSPAASVLSDVSEYGLPISPKGRARIF